MEWLPATAVLTSAPTSGVGIAGSPNSPHALHINPKVIAAIPRIFNLTRLILRNLRHPTRPRLSPLQSRRGPQNKSSRRPTFPPPAALSAVRPTRTRRVRWPRDFRLCWKLAVKGAAPHSLLTSCPAISRGRAPMGYAGTAVVGVNSRSYSSKKSSIRGPGTSTV